MYYWRKFVSSKKVCFYFLYVIVSFVLFYFLASAVYFYIFDYLGFTPRLISYYLSWLLVPIVFLLCIILSIAFLTLLERSILSIIQHRRGPNVVGFFGLAQPLSDAFKLLFKEVIIPMKANNLLFVFSSFWMLILSLISWLVIPFNFGVVISEFPVALLFIYSILSLNIYGLIFAGWSSNSRYAFLGSLRACAQLLSYELIMGTIIITVCFLSNSLTLSGIVEAQTGSWLSTSTTTSIEEVFRYYFDQQGLGWYGIWFFPLFILFFISCLAETNRPPFDFPEAESELVSGYNVEYSAMSFAFFFLAEYGYILLMSNLSVILFFGAWNPLIFFLDWIPYWFWYSIKLWFILYLFVWVRGTLPRYRYDQLMSLGWKVLLPITLAYCFFLVGGVSFFSCFISGFFFSS